MTSSKDSIRPAWGRIVAFGLLMAGCVVLFLDSWSILAERWMKWSHGYDHGWLVAGLTVWLVWRRRGVMAAGKPWWPGLLVLLGAVLAWLLARVADVVIVQEIMLPVLLWASLLTVFGWRAGVALLFPVGFLFYAIPVWDYLNGFLQAVTTMVVGSWVSASGIPALIEGNFVTIPAGRFEIAAGCAGQAFFVTAGALAALYGHLHYQAPGRRLLLILVAFAGAMFVNWLRVYIVIIAGHLTDMQHYLVRVDHYTFGWVLFALALIPFYWFARRLEDAPAAPEKVAAGEVPAPPDMGRTGWTALLASLAVLALPAWVLSNLASESPEAGTAPVLPPPPAGWDRVEVLQAPDWRPMYYRADDELWARFQAGRDGSDPVDLWIVHYASQGQGKELVYFKNHLADPREWAIRREAGVRSDPPMREALIVNRDGDQRLVRWWYEVGGWNTTSPAGAKLRQIAARFSGRPEASLVAFSTACGQGCEEASTRLDAFSRAINRQLRAAVYSKKGEGPG